MPEPPGGDGHILSAARADAASWAAERLVWHQAWGRPDLVLHTSEYRRRMDAWHRQEEQQRPIRPSRHMCLSLFAAYAQDVAGLSLTVSGYREAGGVHGAIAQTAEPQIALPVAAARPACLPA